jgi:hypothetical protein
MNNLDTLQAIRDWAADVDGVTVHDQPLHDEQLAGSCHDVGQFWLELCLVTTDANIDAVLATLRDRLAEVLGHAPASFALRLRPCIGGAGAMAELWRSWTVAPSQASPTSPRAVDLHRYPTLEQLNDVQLEILRAESLDLGDRRLVGAIDDLAYRRQRRGAA